ncbi:MAG: hypothetical protein ACI9WV_000209 [Patiriisocius sp.]|jgi:hypothetical protein
MKKVVSVTVLNLMGSSSKEYVHREFEELNKLLESGWVIHTQELVNSLNNSCFSIIYTLEKELDS